MADIHIMMKRLMSRNTCFMWKVKVLVTQLCPILCDPMDNTPPGFSAHGIFQARILEWVAIPFSRGCSWPRDRTRVSHSAGRFFTVWATREALLHIYICNCQYSIILTYKNGHFMWFNLIQRILPSQFYKDHQPKRKKNGQRYEFTNEEN